MRKCLITHTDLDGVGCAILFLKAFGDKNINIYHCNYDQVDHQVKAILNHLYNYDAIYITDISVSQDIAKQIDRYGEGRFRLFDHHSTAKELNAYWWAQVKSTDEFVKTCGTQLFYKYLIQQNLLLDCKRDVHLVEQIRSYDTWDWTLDNNRLAKDYNDLFYIIGRERFIEWCITTDATIGDKEKLLLDIAKSDREEYAFKKSLNRTEVSYKGYSIGVVFADNHISEVGQHLIENSSMDFCAIINMSKKTISFRTKKDIDVAMFAKRYFNGGGHPKSAGGKLKYGFLLRVICKMWFRDLLR